MFLISKFPLATSITVDTIETMVLGERGCDDWVVFSEENKALFNYWFSKDYAQKYIEKHELEGCVVIESKYKL